MDNIRADADQTRSRAAELALADHINRFRLPDDIYKIEPKTNMAPRRLDLNCRVELDCSRLDLVSMTVDHPPLSSASADSWTAFVDNYDVSVSSVMSLLHRLSRAQDLPQQRRVVDDVEQAIFDCKRQIEDVSVLIPTFRHDIRSRAVAHVEQYKTELEEHYTLLLHYQHAHRQGAPFVVAANQTNAHYLTDDPSAALLSESTAAASYTARQLSLQRESLERELDAVVSAQSALSNTERAVDAVRRTLYEYRRTQYAIIAVECAVILALIYFKYIT